MQSACPACGSTAFSTLYEVPRVPIHCGLLMPSRDAAVGYPSGEIHLAICGECGLIANRSFRPELLEYSPEYNETQAFSPTFSAFQKNLATRLIERHGLHGKDVLEIGCGKGEFLVLLSHLGPNRGTGFDPSYTEGTPIPEGCDVEFVRDFYSARYADRKAAFVCCNMTLEHIACPADFLRTIRLALRPDSVAFFMLPDAGRILDEAAFWDVYYEHCNYFTETSLHRLCTANGFRVLSLEKEYAGQYLAVTVALAGEETPAAEDTAALASLQQDAASFRQRSAEKDAYWKAAIQNAEPGGIVIWGGGSKTVAFLTGVGDGGRIEYVVDINPGRQGTWLAGCGHKIVAPEFLIGYQPRTVIVMNPVYGEEIRAMLHGMGLDPLILTCE